MKEKKQISWKEGIFLAIGLTLFLRLILFVVGYNFAIRFNHLPLTTREMDFAENIPMDKKDPWYFIVSPLHRFDALWYEEISKNNYRNQPLTTAFFPLFPWIVGSMGRIFHTSFAVSAFFINTFLTSIVFYLLYHLARMDHDENVAFRTVIIYAFFPASFFLLVPYAEPLLFVLFLLSMFLIRKEKIILSILIGSIAAITKPYAAVISLPLAFVIFKNRNIYRTKKKYYFIFLILIPLSYFGISRLQGIMEGAQNSPLLAQFKWGGKIPLPWEPLFFQLSLFSKNLFDLPNDFSLIVMISALLFFFYTYKKIRLEWWIYTLSLYIAVYFFSFRPGIILSMSRHALAFFPIFIYISNLKVKRIIEITYLSTSVFLYILFFVNYTFGFFVA